MSGELFNFENLKLAEDMPIGTSQSSADDYSPYWGVHYKNVVTGNESGALSIKQVLIWGGVAFLGWWLYRKIKGSR